MINSIRQARKIKTEHVWGRDMITDKDITIKIIEERDEKGFDLPYLTYIANLNIYECQRLDKTHRFYKDIEEEIQKKLKRSILKRLYGDLYNPIMEAYIFSKKRLFIYDDPAEFDRIWAPILEMINPK